MKKLKYRIPLFVIVFIWGALTAFCWLKPADDFSESERRRLAAKPKLSAASVFSGSYGKEFETYSMEQFPMRDTFRTLKAVSELYLFGKSDNNNIYIADGYAAKMEYPLNEDSVEYAVKKLNELYEICRREKAGKVYLSIVPDKGYFLAGETGHLSMDYQTLMDTVRAGLPDAVYIDIISELELSDYYKTDAHWRQEAITGVAELLADFMGTGISGEYREVVADRPFYGVYYGQSALPLKSDTLCYLTNEVLEGCRVYTAEEQERAEAYDSGNQESMGLYDLEKLEGRDMYEVYLSGAEPVLYIENPGAAEKRELVIFRDSFASSLAPLLAEGYSKITLVDTRYMQPSMVAEYVDFFGADVLFLYSTTILNNSRTLR